MIFQVFCRRPDNVGHAAFLARGRRLAVCHHALNCVATVPGETAEAASIAPFSFSGMPDENWNALRATISATPRLSVVEEEDGYLHVEARTLLGFVDDLEFARDGDVIAVRSASRLGKSDLGANRRRLEALRQQTVTRLANDSAADRAENGVSEGVNAEERIAAAADPKD